MQFVGIRKCREKALVQRCARPEIRVFPTHDLFLDGQRHLEFLRLVDQGIGPSDYPNTLYWKFLAYTDSPEEKARVKMEAFAELYRSVKERGLDEMEAYGALADNGARLDGSHRAAVACALGMPSLPVYFFQWRDAFSEVRVLNILDETRVKIDGYHAYLGKSALDREMGERLGAVVIVDARPMPHPFWRFWTSPRHEPYVVIDQRGGGWS